MIKLKQLIEEGFESAAGIKKQHQMQKMGEKEGSFADWVKNNSKEINATEGNKEKLKQLIKNAIVSKKLNISNDYWNRIVDKLDTAYSDYRRLYFMYNSMLRGQGLSTRRY